MQAMARLDESVAYGESGSGGTGGKIQFMEDTGNVTSSRAAADEEHLGDLLVRAPRYEKPQYLSFTRGKTGTVVARGCRNRRLLGSCKQSVDLGRKFPSGHPSPSFPCCKEGIIA